MARILGIEVGSGSVRGTVVRTTLKKVEVERYLEVPFEVSTDEDMNTMALGNAIHTVLVALGRTPDRVVVALDGREASLRVVELPAGAAKRVAEVLPFELESILPIDMDEAVIDHQPVERDATTLKVLAAAAPKERVADALERWAALGLEPRELAVGAAALDGLAVIDPELSTGTTTMILDMSLNHTDVCVLRNGQCRLARTLSSGVQDSQSGRLERELLRTLTALRATGEPEVDRVVLCGEVTADERAGAWLEQKLDKPVSLLTLPPAPGTEGAGSARFGRATALACRPSIRTKHLDLRKGEFASKQTSGIIQEHARLIAICAGVVFLSFTFSILARWAVLDGEKESLEEQLAHVTKDTFGEEYRTASSARTALERGPRNRDPMPRFDAYDALDVISASIPAEITHTTRRLHIDLDDDGHGGEFEIQGGLASVAERDQIAEHLEANECVQEIQKGRTTPGAGNVGLNYKLNVTFRCPGAPAKAEGRGRRGDS
jgi:general secretion pathway protein L